jgi:two-component system response regulator FixJ
VHIALIDDDTSVLDSLGLYLERRGIRVARFPSADVFIRSAGAADYDCIIADVRMPGLSGVDLVRRFAGKARTTPIILITGHGDVDMAVTAIKLGASDFIEKPFDGKRLLESIRAHARPASEGQQAAAQIGALRARYDSLTERQRQVLELAATGMSNKEIATQLGISYRTVEIHRAWMMERMGARNLAELVRMELALKSGAAG